MFAKSILPAALLLAINFAAPAAEPLPERRSEARRQLDLGNFKDAAELYRRLALDPANTPRDAADDLGKAFQAFIKLGEPQAADELLEQGAAAWEKSWRVLSDIAELRVSLPPLVARVENRFVRTNRWGNDNRSAAERDRVAAVQLMLRSEKLLAEPSDPANTGDSLHFYRRFADIVARGRLGQAAWRFTDLTDVTSLPEPEDYHSARGRGGRGAPVDADGKPVYYSPPASWADAATDGGRWRWLLGRMAAFGGKDEADWQFARFLLSQFGVQTMGRPPVRPLADVGHKTDEDAATGPFAVRTLKDNETIATLATGLKRFSMPDEFNHILLFRRLAADGAPRYRRLAAAELAHIYENRQQYHQALSWWDRLVPQKPGRKPTEAELAVARIAGKNGRLETGPAAPAGSRPRLPFLFRNGTSVAMTAYRLDEKLLLRDIRAAIKSKSGEIRDNPAITRPERLGWLVVQKNATRYIAEKTAEWEVKLDPLPDYFSRRVSIEMPFSMAGCYLVEAKMADGNTSRAVIWLADLALVRKPAFDKQVCYVADAASGEPAAGAVLSFLGYGQEQRGGRARPAAVVREFAANADANGLAILDTGRFDGLNWLITAETADGRLAYLGFDSIWASASDDDQEARETVFIVTDRPIYRPEQEVNFKLWLGRASYGTPAEPYLANRKVTVEIHNPLGEVVHTETLTTDAHGGASGKLTLGKSAPLGHYSVSANNGAGYLGFRLEEYRKPEFEVTVATPKEALRLGDATTVEIGAKYYFGAPVANAVVAYKVMRTPHDDQWFPPWRWDWLYGRGAWWQDRERPWYPGWERWGAAAPRPAWLPPRFLGPPELVAEGEGKLDADGTFRLPLDTLPAKELYGDRDHKYEITVEVTDQSRRVIVGSGQVVAARQAFKAMVWADRGYYLAGQAIQASFKTLTPLGDGVPAKGKAVLYRISYDAEGNPSEKEAAAWDLATDAEGNASLKLAADVPGQYRLSCQVADAAGRQAEGAAMITVRGDGGAGAFRYAALELLTDQREYRPGDTVRLVVNSERRDAVVLLFPRVERRGAQPAVLRLGNGAADYDLKVGAADQPNLFCEAITIFDGKIHSEVREIFLPSADKTLNVEVTASKPSYAPGDKAEFKIRITDAEGKPVSGQCAVTFYDRSVEYISGGSNVGDIRAFFWNWKRHYYPQNPSSLQRNGYPVTKEDDTRWEPIGVFGSQEADWNEEFEPVAPRSRAGGAMLADAAMPPVPAPAPMAMMAMEAPMQAAYAAAPTAKAESANAVTGGGMVEPTLRSEFADTALWIAVLEADADGRASFNLEMPENLTAWKARVWTMGSETRVGEGETSVETKKNVIVRPQAPRFLTQKDQVVLSANLHNYLPEAKRARAELILEGGLLELAKGAEAVKTVELAANGEARVDWLVNALRPGQARIVMRLLTDSESDAAEIKVPVLLHGSRKVTNFGGILRGNESETVIRFTVPAERLADRSRLALDFSPSVAAPLLAALPYMIEYPYGCTEQTLNRFLPAIMVRTYLEHLGLSLAEAEKAGAGVAADARSAEWLKRFGDARAARAPSPVFDDAELADLIGQGVERLASMQNADGGWGWFSGLGEQSWPHTTAVVMHGLLAAKANGVAVPPAVIAEGVDWLRARQNRELDRLLRYAATDGKEGKAKADNLDAFIYMILSGQGGFNPDLRDFLYRDRLSLSLSGMTMLGLALHAESASNALETVLENLRQYARDDATGSAWLEVPSSGWWWWYNDDLETQAWYLKLLSRTDPHGARTAGLAKYLLKNRKNGSYWRSTRDSAYAVEALAEYAAASGETAPDQTVTVYLDGVKVMERTIRAGNLLDDHRFLLEGVAVEAGEHELRLVRSGAGNLYYGGGLDLFSLEDPIAKAGLDLKIDRAYYKLIREESQTSLPGASGSAVRAKTETYRRQPIPGPFARTGDRVALRPGDLVEVELTIETNNDYEYLVFEDMKAAGLEAVELLSGYSGNPLGAYVEYRDDKVVMFVRHLPRGKYSLGYRFRAETPGAFSALPVFGGGMYATDLFANSDEMKMRIEEPGVY